jgi:hypothetical protein
MAGAGRKSQRTLGFLGKGPQMSWMHPAPARKAASPFAVGLPALERWSRLHAQWRTLRLLSVALSPTIPSSKKSAAEAWA